MVAADGSNKDPYVARNVDLMKLEVPPLVEDWVFTSFNRLEDQRFVDTNELSKNPEEIKRFAFVTTLDCFSILRCSVL